MSVNADAKVAVLMGGLSSEREVSLRTGEAVLAALRRRGWDAVGIDVDRDLPVVLQAEGIDVVWLALHGRYGEDGCVQGLLELAGIPYTGSGVLASAVAMDKHRTKALVRDVDGVVLSPHWLVEEGDSIPAPLPLVVKPAIGGSTVGLTVVREADAWSEALASARGEHPLVMAEGWVDGLEITCAVLDGRPLPLVSIQPQGGLYDYAAKYASQTTRYRCPAPVSEATASQARRAAVGAYEALGCRGLARVDFLVPARGGPVLLEVNTLPGMTSRSLAPMAAAEAGLDFDTLVERILRSATCDP